MSPEKALTLVRRYADTNRRIKDLSKAIGDSLVQCVGLDGKRLELEDGCFVRQRDTDNKGRDKSTHLWHWYQPDVADSGYAGGPDLVWAEITAAEHGAECPHCYAAHLAIQERKAARREFGAIKAAMSRQGGAA